jgi:hypothetical protein
MSPEAFPLKLLKISLIESGSDAYRQYEPDDDLQRSPHTARSSRHRSVLIDPVSGEQSRLYTTRRARRSTEFLRDRIKNRKSDIDINSL